jgi:soluble lytic murein transglycosylase-like protein
MLAEAANATNTDRSAVIGAIQRAASATGADFNYLLGTAMRESSLKPGAKASSSSATGLYQFVDQTWLGRVPTAATMRTIPPTARQSLPCARIPKLPP